MARTEECIVCSGPSVVYTVLHIEEGSASPHGLARGWLSSESRYSPLQRIYALTGWTLLERTEKILPAFVVWENALVSPPPSGRVLLFGYCWLCKVYMNLISHQLDLYVLFCLLIETVCVRLKEVSWCWFFPSAWTTDVTRLLFAPMYPSLLLCFFDNKDFSCPLCRLQLP